MKLNKHRGQCYDGCSTMGGRKNGVVVQIKEEERRAIYTRCCKHPLNLGIGDLIRIFDILEHTINDTFELMTLAKNLPKRDPKLKKI